jgi:regulator of protease activity HflC (stomatin/prohibitin superfamily)
MERSTQKNGLVNLLALLVVGVAGFAVARNSNSLAGQVGTLFLGMGLLVAAVSWFQMRLEENERLEKLELEDLARTHAGSAMFEAKESEVFPAQRSREQFERVFVPAFTVLLCLLQSAGAYWFWRWLGKPTTVADLKQPTIALGLFGVFALVLFLLGRFSATYARLENNRLLRPSASYVLLNAFICGLVAAGIIAAKWQFPKADLVLAHVLCGLLALVAVETLIALVLEIYRPRVKGKIERPLYESRLVGLLAQPEGLVTTAAQAVDYQFGFKVSETWFYRLFFERALKWLLLLQGGVLLLSTCLVFIDAGEQGLLERFGRPVEGRTVLEAGAHLKLPWPIDRVYRSRTEQIQTLEIGVTGNSSEEKEPVVLWTRAHARPGTKEEDFLVANRDQGMLGATNEPGGKRTPPVSFITGSIPVQFQITNLMLWSYTNEDAPSLLHDVATREVVRYFASADMNDLMSSGRLRASETLAHRIQAAADERDLGVRILAVALQDMHPPVKVAKDYEDVVAATQTKLAKILNARADQVRTNNLAGAQAATILDKAAAEREATQARALAQAALFTNQIPAFRAAPSVYVERAYLRTFTRATASARKYLMLTTNTHDVLIFDLQDRIRPELLENLNVSTNKPTK